jgi:hypothetical protein
VFVWGNYREGDEKPLVSLFGWIKRGEGKRLVELGIFHPSPRFVFLPNWEENLKRKPV